LKTLRIAVIGSGISGLSAAWLLSQRHDVTLIEQGATLGGHAHTADVLVKGRGPISIDTGFIVSNTWTYPNFTALMDYLEVPMLDTAMSFSVSMDRGRYEYAGDHLGTLLGTARQWFQPKHWRMMADLVRFYRTAEEKAKTVPADVTLGQWLSQEGFGETFIRRHILPIAGAIWSSTPDQIAAYPFRAFINFFSNHRLFILGKRPNWRTVRNGSREYVNRLVADSKFRVMTESPVARIHRHFAHVDVSLKSGAHLTFDHVVLATHADQALRLLADPSVKERELLSPFKTSLNRVILHRDPSLMPRTKRLWAAWNYAGEEEGKETKLAVTYWMNALQKLDSPEQHLVSLNPLKEPSAEKTDATYFYRHPIFNAATLAAQKDLWNLQGVNRTWFAGAWFGAGFHEDGAQAGLAVAEQLGDLTRPWVVANPSGRIHVKDILPPLDTPFIEAAE
jgi:uncharacterized protein